MPRLTRIKELQIIWQTWIILKSGLENVTLFLSRVYKTLNRRFQKHVNQACSHVVTVPTFRHQVSLTSLLTSLFYNAEA